jgi:hypothetical protein
MNQQRAKFLGMLLGLSILAGCSSASGGGGSTPVPTATLTATPATITAGQENSTLAFTSTNANAGSIDNGVGPVGTNSHISVSPALTTTYTYTATGPGGSATAKATVTVTPAGPAPTVTLSASPASVFSGQQITLAWTSTNAAFVVIDNLGAVQPASGGSITVSPTRTTIYTATATGDGQQATATADVTVSPVTSFDGMVEDPANIEQDIDPNGAVGTVQFMEYVNTEFQAYDKHTFAPVWLTPQPIGTPWNAIPECAGTSIQLDTVINFDRLASRWVIAAKATRPNHYYLCIAVSNTDDLSSPTLTWHAYFSDLSPYLTNPTTGMVYFPDWPKLGIWPDAYYFSMDMQDLSNSNAEVGIAVCALDRTNMLLGNTMSHPQCFNETSPLSNGLYLGHSLIPAEVDGATPPPPGRDEFLVSIQNPTNDGSTTTSTTINLWDFHVDWTNPANTTFTLAATPTVTTYTPGCYDFAGKPALTNCVPEPPGNQHIDSVGDRLMPRFAYRNFGAYESFLISHTVQTGLDFTHNPLQTGIRWYELRGSGVPAVHQSGTINPDNSLFRFLPSIAQDKDGNAAVGYSVSNSFTNPGMDFSYWSLATNNAPTEVTILEGAGEEITPLSGNGQWGTYSSMTVDPADDCTFWYVNEYWPTNSAWATRIANFKIPGCQ